MRIQDGKVQPVKPLPPENRIIWSSPFGDRYLGLCCRDCHKLKPYYDWRPLRRWWSRNRLCWCLPERSPIVMETAAPYPIPEAEAGSTLNNQPTNKRRDEMDEKERLTMELDSSEKRARIAADASISCAKIAADAAHAPTEPAASDATRSTK